MSAKPSNRGTLLVIAIFLLGGLMLVGLFMAPRGKPPTTMPAM
jgi:hypothetical protein